MPASADTSQEPGSLRRRLAKAVAGRLLPSTLLVFRGPEQSRKVALTFDDGPSAITPAYLDVLDRYDAKATFFVLGCCCALRQDGLREIIRRGHELGSHGYTHRGFGEMTRDELKGELQNTASLMPAPVARRLLRPPKGSLSPSAFVTCAAAGYTTVMWSYDSRDCRIDNAAELGRRLRQAEISGGEVVLFHDGQPWTLEALPAFLKQLRENGHELVTVSELLRG